MNGLSMKYFVLKPRGNDLHAIASRRAMRTYAFCIEEIDQDLAADLLRWIRREEKLANKPLDSGAEKS